MRSSKAILIGALLLSAFFISSCETSEDRKIAAAQECLNRLGDAPSTTAVDACIGKVSGIDNEQSNIILCSAYFIRGGLTNSKIITAFEDYGDAAKDEKEAVLIDALALTGGSAKADAEQAYNYCNKTNVPGLAYVASLCRIGTLVKEMGNADINDNIDDFINTVTGADKEAVGQMVASISSLYCQGEAKKSNICVEIFSAQQAAGSDYEQLANILLQQFL